MAISGVRTQHQVALQAAKHHRQIVRLYKEAIFQDRSGTTEKSGLIPIT